MRLTTALDEYKRAGDDRFPEEMRTDTGAFSGHGDRLVHVDNSGALRDYSASLSGLYGIDRSKLGIRTANGTEWFTELDTIRQHYYRDTRLVETEYDAGAYTIHQYDLTLGRSHVTHVGLRGQVPADAELVAFLTLAPEGTEAGVGALVHAGAGPDESQVLEVYHRDEHDYVAASTGLRGVYGQRPERFAEILDDDPVHFPRGDNPHVQEESRLTGDFVVTAPLEEADRSHRTTLVTQLSDHTEVNRDTALTDVQRCASTHATADAVRGAARDRSTAAVPETTARPTAVQTDLRAIDLLAAPSGGHIAAPEFDPFHANSGGYGYVWFRDDAAVGLHLLEAGAAFGIDVTNTLTASAAFHCETQTANGTWPHRVWATDGSLAPGWANENVERDGDAVEYQADQTATVTAFLATLLTERGDAVDDALAGEIHDTLASAVDALIADLAANDLPSACQNVWEDATGQFTHTAATYIRALAAVAQAPVGAARRERAQAAAETVLDGLADVWDETQGAYPMRIVDDTPDYRLDAATLELVEAISTYSEIDGVTLGTQRLKRLTTHVTTTVNGLYREPTDSAVAGLIRYEGDRWRTAEQEYEKVWSVATGLGAVALARLSGLHERHDQDAAAHRERAGELYALLEPDGPFASDAGYLAEQAFDDGTLDSAAPLCWTHGLRLQATALLEAQDALPAAATETEGPAEQPRWTTGEKYGVGTAADHGTMDPSRVWFTLTEGAVTEVRFPRVDLMNLRTLDFLVSDPDGEYTIRTHVEDRTADAAIERRVEPVGDDALLFRHVFTESGDGRDHAWQLTVEYATDPAHDALLADVTFDADDGHDYDVFVVADTALTNSGTADKGLRLGEPDAYHLAARDPQGYTGESDASLLVDDEGDGYSTALALTSRDRFDWATVGVAGSDPVRALFSEGAMAEPRTSVDDDTVVLIGRLATSDHIKTTLALGFARAADTAGALGEADGALNRGYETARAAYRDTWAEYLEETTLPSAVANDDDLAAQYRTALMTLYAVEDKTYHGASIASPSVPWGEAVVADEQRGYGYNFVWARDLYQVFTAFEAVDKLDIAAAQLAYIYEYQQDETGFIPQNTYINGSTRWGGEQMDNISFPAVMAYRLYERGLTFDDVAYDYADVRRSANYIARNGPATAQERWEEESGYSPSSIAAEIAGLACASRLAMETGHEGDALVWLALADHWTNNVEEWTVTATGTDRHDTPPYYLRVTRDGEPDAGHLRRLANDGPTLDERNIIDAGFLELVRLGVKPPADPIVRNSIDVVDQTIRVDTDPGACFYRYNGDGYGERARENVGGPWSVEHKGKGRLWPLLSGERGEYELRADDSENPSDYWLRAMASYANSGRMLPEQIWDRHHSTAYGWQFGKGTGAATPLAWAMAQYVRLAHGISAGDPVETPAFVADRYCEQGLYAPDESPALRVDTQFRGDTLVVTGETTGDRVAVNTTVAQHVVEVPDTEFETTIAIGPGQNQVIVAAGSEDLTEAGTTVRRLRL